LHFCASQARNWAGLPLALSFTEKSVLFLTNFFEYFFNFFYLPARTQFELKSFSAAATAADDDQRIFSVCLHALTKRD
jgi:hypothetical protein